MPGRTETKDEADGEWSDASDDAVKSGSATDASRTEGDDINGRHLGGGGKSSSLSLSMRTSTTSLGHKDPVHSILDKIDAELAAMASVSPRSAKSSLRTSSTSRPKSSLPPMLSQYTTIYKDSKEKAGLANGLSGNGTLTEKEQQKIAGSAEIYTDATLTDDEAKASQATDDFLSDLDAMVAQQIDSRFKEIMIKKKSGTSPLPPSSSSPPPPSFLTLSPPTPLSTYLDAPNLNPNPTPTPTPSYQTFRPPLSGYGTDNDSIKTEDFENRFQNLIVMTDGANSSCDGGGGGGGGGKIPRPKRAKNSNSHGGGEGAKKGGSGSGLRWAGTKNGASGGGGGGGGKVSFDVSAKEKHREDKAAASSSGVQLNRVLHHSMKSIGDANVKKPVDPESSALVSLPPSGRSHSVSPERLTSGRPKPTFTLSEQTNPEATSVALTHHHHHNSSNSSSSKTLSTKTNQLDSARAEIERQSARIQREMERERRCRSVSPTRGLLTSSSMTSSAVPSRSAAARAPTPALLQTSEFQTDTLTVSSLENHLEHADKMILGQELKTLRGALMTTKLQLKEAEKEARTMREKAEEARSELMLIDFKRTTATKDLQRLSEDVERKRATLHGYDNEMTSRRNEMRGMEALVKDQMKLLQEENVGLKQRLRGVQGLEMERDELARQAEAAKEDLLREQRQSRLHREEMNEEIETLTARLEEAQNGWTSTQQQLSKLDNAFKTMEREKNQLIQEQSKEYSALKSQTLQESKESRHMASREMDLLNQDMVHLRTQLTDLQDMIKVKEEDNRQLREEVVALTREVTQEQSARASITEEHRKTLQMLRRETDSAMLQLRESLFLEKQRAVEELRGEVEQERRDSAFRNDERMAQLLAQNADFVAEKDQEIALLQEKARDLQELQHATEARMQESLEYQIREAVTRERLSMESDTQRQLRSERETAARDSKQRIGEMQNAVERERDTTQRLIRELELMKKELEEQRKQSREAVKDKVTAVAKAKDEVRVQSSKEMDSAKEQIRKEMQREVDRLQDQLRRAEEEARALKQDKQAVEGRERDKQHALERAENTVITEINEECRRSAAMLGVTPRQVQLSNVTDSTSTRALITAALANLRAVNEELRNQLEDVTSELESCRAAIASLQKEQVEAIERVRLEMETQKTLDLEKVKEKLIKEHTEELARVAQASARQSLSNAMVGALRRKDTEIEQLKQALTTSRQQETEKHARLYQRQLAQELENSQALMLQTNQDQKRVTEQQQREINRLEKEVQRLAAQQTKDSSSPSLQHQQQQYLQARIKQLNVENSELRKKHLLSKHNVSVPDLSSTTALSTTPASPRRSMSPGPGVGMGGGKLRSLEERLRRGEKEALLAEERARVKQSALHQKMNDMAKLQNTLSDQNQELLRLEHAYSQLHRQYNDTPTTPITHILNNTR